MRALSAAACARNAGRDQTRSRAQSRTSAGAKSRAPRRSIHLQWDRTPEAFDPDEARENAIDFLVTALEAKA
jgi:hypothetical protein